MADYKKIVTWILKNRSRYGISIEEILSTCRYSPSLADCRVAAKIGNYEIIGRSVAETPENALFVAGCEFIERLLIHEHNLYPGSGVAIHTELREAEKNAAYELIERDALLTHTLLKIPFSPVLDTSSNIYSQVTSIEDRLGTERIRIRFYTASATQAGLTTSICRITGNSDNQIFGFGCQKNSENAHKKSFREAIQNLPSLLESSGKTRTTLEAFSRLTLFDPSDHGFLGLDPKYNQQIEWMFPDHCENAPIRYPNPRFTFERFNSDLIEKDLGLFLVRARSEDVQNYYLGQTAPEVINWKALATIMPKVTFENINRTPHFIG
jgi:hypothetical protein